MTSTMEVISAPGVVLVDFWADWCVPCKQLAPIIDEIAAEFPQVKVVKVNIEEESDLVQSMNVMSVPTLVVLKDGFVEARMGAVSKSTLLARLQEHLG